MKKIFKIFGFASFILFLVFASFWFLGSFVKARDKISDWYIRDFESIIVVNKDSTIEVTEKITADCGNLPDKHGIFRVLPTISKTDTEEIKTPVELVSIKHNGGDVKYSTEKSLNTNTITYKIGDPDKTVSGVNNYEIKYRVKNTVRFANSEFDEFYWNLNGNFWEIETDHFKTNITFPAEVNKENTEIDYYTGSFGSKDKSKAAYRWVDKNILEVETREGLNTREGVTLSAAMPKNIFATYILTQEDEKQYLDRSSYFQKYYPGIYNACNWFLGLVFPILILFLCFKAWKKYGNDPDTSRSIMPEFEIPQKMTPMELGLVYTNGSFKNPYFAAEIINLAVKGVIKIEEMNKKSIWGSKDYKFILIKKDKSLSKSEKLILDLLFAQKDERLVSSLREDRTFYLSLQTTAKTIDDELTSQGLVDLTGTKFKIAFIIFSVLLLAGSFFIAAIFPFAFLGVVASAIIMAIFAIIMPRRTTKGMDLYYKILGFKLYMDTAEKYRQQFNEKENIFEKFLPYAIMFGITKEWTKKMRTIYKDQLKTYYPVWFIGGNINNFDMESFATTITAVSSSIGTASGAGGAGGAGGGGGGGGGGGW